MNNVDTSTRDHTAHDQASQALLDIIIEITGILSPYPPAATGERLVNLVAQAKALAMMQEYRAASFGSLIDWVSACGPDVAKRSTEADRIRRLFGLPTKAEEEAHQVECWWPHLPW